MDAVRVADEGVRGCLAGGDGFDEGFCGDFLEPLDNVVSRPGHRRDKGAVADGGVGAGEDEVVGEVRSGEGEVGVGLRGPFVGESDAMAAGDREVRDVTCLFSELSGICLKAEGEQWKFRTTYIKASSADDDIELDKFVACLYTSLGDMLDW